MTLLRRPDAHGPATPSPAAIAATPRAGREPELEGQWAALRLRLLRHARFAVHNHSLAEDLVQGTLIAVVEQHAKRRGDASLVTWAMAILMNKVADWYRSPSRKRMVQLSEDDDRL